MPWGLEVQVRRPICACSSSQSSKFAPENCKFAPENCKFAPENCKFAGCGRICAVNSTPIAARPCAAIASIIIIT